jgi:hypothetical protein
MKTYGAVDVQIQIFLTSALLGGEWSDSHPARFTQGERAPGTHWIGGWVGPRTGLDHVEKRKFFTLSGLELRPLGRRARSQSLYRLCYPWSINIFNKFWIVHIDYDWVYFMIWNKSLFPNWPSSKGFSPLSHSIKQINLISTETQTKETNWNIHNFKCIWRRPNEPEGDWMNIKFNERLHEQLN